MSGRKWLWTLHLGRSLRRFAGASASGLPVEGRAGEEAGHIAQAPDGAGQHGRQDGEGALGTDLPDQADDQALGVPETVEHRQGGGIGPWTQEGVERATLAAGAAQRRLGPRVRGGLMFRRRAAALDGMPALGRGEQLLRQEVLGGWSTSS